MKYAAVFVASLVLPFSFALANTTGFAQGSVWLSHTPTEEGETVLIHAALTNGSSTKLTGTLIFKDNGQAIGSVPFSLTVGEARIVSLSWQATTGNHSIAASIADASDTSVAGTQTVNVAVAAKPEPVATPASASTSGTTKSTSNAANVAYSSSDDIQKSIGSVSPQAQGIVAPAFDAIDSVRKSAGIILGAETSDVQAKVTSLSAQKAKLAKQTTPEAKTESHKVTFYQIAMTVLLYICEVLLVVVSKAAYFYPIFAFIIFFLLYKGYQRFRRPNYDY